MNLQEIIIKLRAYQTIIDAILAKLSYCVKEVYNSDDLECISMILDHVAEMQSLISSLRYSYNQMQQDVQDQMLQIQKDMSRPFDTNDMDGTIDDISEEASEYKGKKVTLNRPFRTPSGPKKFSVYVKNDKGNIVKVNFGDPNMEIKRDDPQRRKNYRARHNCDNPGPKWKANYWSCKMWSNKPVTEVLASKINKPQEASKVEKDIK
jgi:hypothetical protein